MVFSTLRGALAKRPLLKSIFTVTSLFGASDLCCQLIENHGDIQNKFDWKRLQKMATIGLTFYGPAYYYYYGFLDRRFPGKDPRTVAIKVCFDQIVWAIPSLFVFFCIAGKLERKTNAEIKEKIRQKYIPTYVTATMFWPGIQLVNFSLVPASYRILFVSGANFIWLNFLSFINNRPKLPVFLEKVQSWTIMSNVEEKPMDDDDLEIKNSEINSDSPGKEKTE